MNKSIKKIILLSTIPFLLTGCFATDENGTVSATKLYETESFSISVPEDWEILEENDFMSNIPKQTIAAFRNNIKSDIFNANVNISAETTNLKNPSDLAKNSKANAKTSLVSFEEIKTENAEVIYGETTTQGVIMEFQGKKTAQESIIRFKQLYVISTGIAYTVTAAYLPAEDTTVVKYMDEMLDSFALK